MSTHFRRLAVGFAVSALLMLAVAASAQARWIQVSQVSGSNTDAPGAVRGADGTLHVTYREQESASSNAIKYRYLTSAGTWGGPVSVQSGWAAVTNPDVEILAGVPNVFWSGIGTTDVSDPTSTGKGWSASLAGAGFTRAAAAMTTSQSVYASTSVSTAVGSDSQPALTYSGTGLNGVHVGLTAAGTESNFSTGCCQYAGNLATDAVSGSTYLYYTSNETGMSGAWTQMVHPTLGAPRKLSTISPDFLGRINRLPAVARSAGGGTYSAFCDTYPSCTRIRVAGSGTRSLRFRPATDINQEKVWLSAGPEGRVWLAVGDNSNRIYVARSNKAMTRWGTTQRVTAPRRTESTWNLSGDGARGPLDLLVNATTNGSTLVYHNRIAARFDIAPSALKLNNSATRTLTFRITDAGDAVVGARIGFRGRTAVTNSRGKASFVVPAGAPTGRYSAIVTASGYASASTRIRIVS